MRMCKSCGRLKPIEDFNKYGKYHARKCKACERRRRNENRIDKQHKVAPQASDENYISLLADVVILCNKDIIDGKGSETQFSTNNRRELYKVPMSAIEFIADILRNISDTKQSKH